MSHSASFPISRLSIDWVRAWSMAMTIVATGAITGMALFLVIGAIPALRHEGIAFFTTADWSYRNGSFGAAAMIWGTCVVTVVALLIATPIGIGASLFLSEIAPRRIRMGLKVIIELLAGIPSVVYGLLGVLYLRNWIATLYERTGWSVWSGDTLLTAGILLAVMILPTLTTFADDAFQSVPARDREAGRGLGMTRWETTRRIVIPKAFPGFIAATMLATGRALGETIAVFLVVGRADNRTDGFLSTLTAPGQTITSKLGGAEPNIAVGDPLHSSAILALGLVLAFGVLLLVGMADLLRHRATGEGTR
ncbi:MAG: phosphate ABC transporter permease subunit PstC [Thermoanaerobaculia bacterium]|nr:phosphate ABC transporter permease subunit PstC [Thermoanaerobaculia bacterium]